MQDGRIEAAAALLRPAANNGNLLAAHLLGLCAFQASRVDEAKKYLNGALALRPVQIDFFLNYAALLINAGDHSAALSVCDSGLQHSPNALNLRYYRAVCLSAISRHEEAIQVLDQLIAQEKLNPDWLCERGVALGKVGRYREAVNDFRSAMRRGARSPAIPYNLSKALFELGAMKDALEQIDLALAIVPQDALIHSQRGCILAELGAFDDAIKAHRLAVSLAPHRSDLYLNLSAALNGAGHFAEALIAADAAVNCDPQNSDAMTNRGNALRSLSRNEEAIEAFNAALAISPRHIGATLNRGLCMLTLGMFDSGFSDYERRFDSRVNDSQLLGSRLPLLGQARRDLTIEELEGQHVIVVDEQGVGDTVMFASIIPDLLHVAASVEIVCDERLVTLLRASFPALVVTGLNNFLSRGAAEGILLFIGSLGRPFRSSVHDFPGHPYLRPDQGCLDKWERHLAQASSRQKVGISWKGGTARTRTGARSLGPSQLTMLSMPNVDFVNIQFGACDDELRDVSASLGRALIDFDPVKTYCLHDLAALIASLDAVVTVQNSNVHIAGAVGTPCLAIIPSIPEWRYGVKGSRMPWYASVELFRRNENISLDEGLKSVRERLGLILGE